ncbi:MAG: histidinol-phosphate transaminase [Betaproteobacteria bacterium]|nr:MAG: histidinol-phosphate transaminase [Betaproteobacteria bacterium]
MSRFWSAVTHGLTPYVPGEQPKLANLVKLNTNENPYPPSPKVLEAIAKATNDTLRLYPDPNSDALRAAIAVFHGVTADQVFVGNGSDEVLAHTFLGLLKHDRPILFPDISYSFYPVYCGLYQIAHREIPLAEDFSLRVDDYLNTPNGTPNGGIIFPNPNAPTGRALAVSEVERLLAGNPDSVVVVDEAYGDFCAESAVALIQQYPQLLVVRTLSKAHSLAGLRVGYALGQAGLIEGLNRVKDSFNSYPLDRLAQAGATACMQDRAYLEATLGQVIASRERLTAGLTALGFLVLPSGANFVFARHLDHDGAALTAALRARSILVRHFKQPARIAPFLRISVGTDPECVRLLQALREICG